MDEGYRGMRKVHGYEESGGEGPTNAEHWQTGKQEQGTREVIRGTELRHSIGGRRETRGECLDVRMLVYTRSEGTVKQ